MPDKSLMAKLRATTAVTTLVGGSSPRIRCGQLMEGDVKPGIVIERDTVRPVNHAGGTTGTKFGYVFVHCHATDYATAEAVADAVETALNGYTNTTGTPAISMVHVQDVMYNPGPMVSGQDKIREQFTLDCLVQYSTS